jgi:hypothetical protein
MKAIQIQAFGKPTDVAQCVDIADVGAPDANEVVVALDPNGIRARVAETNSVSNPLHIFEQDFLSAAVIKFRGPTIGVTGNSLGRLQSPVIGVTTRNGK